MSLRSQLVINDTLDIPTTSMVRPGQLSINRSFGYSFRRVDLPLSYTAIDGLYLHNIREKKKAIWSVKRTDRLAYRSPLA